MRMCVPMRLKIYTVQRRLSGPLCPQADHCYTR